MLECADCACEPSRNRSERFLILESKQNTPFTELNSTSRGLSLRNPWTMSCTGKIHRNGCPQSDVLSILPVFRSPMFWATFQIKLPSSTTEKLDPKHAGQQGAFGRVVETISLTLTLPGVDASLTGVHYCQMIENWRKRVRVERTDDTRGAVRRF